MKGLLLAGTLFAGSWFGQGWDISSSDLNQLWAQLQQEIVQQIQSHIQISESGQQQDISDEQLRQLIQNFNEIHDSGLKQKLKRHHLPVQQSTQNEQVNQIEISAGDQSVSSTTINQTQNTIREISIPILQQNVGTPTQKVQIVLFSSSRTYANALQNAGMARSEVKKFTRGTQGLTVDNEIWIPLYNLEDKSELANVITHELTHAILNQKGIGDTIPVWVNEGTAWHNGLLAKAKISPAKTKQMEAALNQQIQTVASEGKLLPLTATEDDIVSAPYTVEWVDYLAVKDLIDHYGMNTFLTFLGHIGDKGVDQAFQTDYQQSIASYEQNFYNQLSQVE